MAIVSGVNIPDNKRGLGFGFMYGISPVIGAIIAIIGGYTIENYTLNSVFYLASIRILFLEFVIILIQLRINIIFFICINVCNF